MSVPLVVSSFSQEAASASRIPRLLKSLECLRANEGACRKTPTIPTCRPTIPTDAFPIWRYKRRTRTSYNDRQEQKIIKPLFAGSLLADDALRLLFTCSFGVTGLAADAEYWKRPMYCKRNKVGGFSSCEVFLYRSQVKQSHVSVANRIVSLARKLCFFQCYFGWQAFHPQLAQRYVC